MSIPALARVARLACTALLAAACASLATAAVHPMDPLGADEILEAANILLRGGAAQPGAIFQSIELREPSKAEVLAYRRGNALPRSASAFRNAGSWNTNEKSLTSWIVRPSWPSLIGISTGGVNVPWVRLTVVL